MKHNPQTGQPCPCQGTGAAGKPCLFANCCGRYLDDWQNPAPDAESLMRSRYSAFVLAREPYLLSTWHSSTRPESLETEPGLKWLGLQIKQHTVTGADTSEVEFVARYRTPSGKAERLHERSRFVREEGRWFYVDGDFPS